MGKVITSEGLTEFVQSGKFTSVANHNKKDGTGGLPKLETVAGTPTLDVKPLVAEIKVTAPEVKALEHEPDDALTEEEKALPEKAQKEIQRTKRSNREKHRQMMEAREEAERSDRLAEQQYNERRLAEQRADAAEARARELEAKLTPSKPETKEPAIDDYKLADGNYDWVKFQKDTAKYAADEAIKGERERQAGEQSEKDKQAKIAIMTQRATEARKAHPDYDEVFAALKGTDADKVPNFVLSFIEESEASAEVAYHLAKNSELRERISKMKPILGIAELGKLAASLVQPPSLTSSPEAKSVTPVRANGGAPAPITPLDGEDSAGINTDPAKMSYKELRAYHKAREAERRKH